MQAHSGLSGETKKKWVRWNIPAPPDRNTTLSDLIEEHPIGVTWHAAAVTKPLWAMMNDVNRAKLAAAKHSGNRMVGGVYRRTRADENGVKTQRARCDSTMLPDVCGRRLEDHLGNPS